ncbi:zinc finger CCCH domain-containing protein 10 [Galendromus occidentalis]|uniref:Zinc finger CCCH domain-containing protein 10 n=1 Tax=Galendromus occidentalis TaxID=34638 RepID=A0AAJ6VZT9_9ACAR|nr:zinc finger CCCH domain-containing protein 10 [Galendromus occidentalis]
MPILYTTGNPLITQTPCLSFIHFNMSEEDQKAESNDPMEMATHANGMLGPEVKTHTNCASDPPKSDSVDHQESREQHTKASTPPNALHVQNQQPTSRGVCRDFLRNVCFRGAQCKFAHPGDSVHGDLVFCHDFQNLGCTRADCKFVHASKDDERRYHESGKLPHSVGNLNSTTDSSEPICKDFLKRQCHRGRRCKFRHELSALSPNDDPGIAYGHARDSTHVAPYYEDRFQMERDIYSPVKPMPRLVERSIDRERWSPIGHKRRRPSSGGPIYTEDDLVGSLERENRILRVRLEDLQKQVKDLMSTNEFLLQQNAELRIAKQARVCQGISGAVMSSAVIPNSTQLLTSNLTTGQVSACSMPNGVLPSAVLGAPTPITSEPVGLVPVSSIITMSSSTTPLVSGFPIVTSQGQLRYNPARS